MIIDNAGTYTLRYTATDDCGKTTTVDRELKVEEPVYGIYWDGTENPQWTRIGKSALFAEPVAQYSDGNGGWVGGSSPFDEIMPWSGMQIVEDSTVGTLVSIPKYYYKWTRSGESDKAMQLEISPSPKEGFFTSPAHADRGDGVGERDIVYVGRYHCVSGYKSQTGATPLTNQTRATFRSGIHGLGADVWQYDFAMYWTIAMLYLVEYANWNSQHTIGFGGGLNSDGQRVNGSTDEMPYHTGTITDRRTTPGPMQYRHIEGLWSGREEFCDGIYFNGTDVYCINNPSNFSDTQNGVLVGTRPTSSSSFIKSFNNPTATGVEYALYPATIGGASGLYMCDNVLYSSAGTVLCVGGNDSNNGIGLFRYAGNLSSTSKYTTMGSRLMKLPSA